VARPLAGRLGTDPDLARLAGAEPNAAVGFVFKRWFDASNPGLDQVLAAARELGERVDLLCDTVFTARELDGRAHYEVVCRSTVGQTTREAERQLAEDRNEPLRDTGSAWHVRLPARIYLSRASRVQPDTISHVDQYTGEYVAGMGVVAALERSGLRAPETRPVVRLGPGAAPADVRHLYTEHFLAPALFGRRSMLETFDDGPGAPSTPRRYGCLAYPPGALDAGLDFARTAEPWAGHQRPGWAVSGRARKWFEAERLRGWAFRPLLVEGEVLEREHEARWGELLDRIAAHPGAAIRV
jgi:hypothetical protein